jgi:acetoacetate decarboxylase
MFRFEDDKTYRIPAHFGGTVFDPEAKAYYHDVMTLGYTYTTDGDRLADYVPEGFELIRSELNVQFQQCRRVEWMAGSYYNLVQVGVPVRFKGEVDRLEGSFALVVWENKTTPILTGREMGVPKIYADIEDLHIIGDTYRTRASYEGSTFLEMEMVGSQPVDERQAKSLGGDVNAFGWRYVPKVGAPGAELSQPILFPMRFETESAWTGSGTLRWTAPTWEQNPTQWQIIKALAELPMLGMSPVMLLKGRAILMEARGRVLR